MQFFMDGGKGICASGWLGLMAATCRGEQEGREAQWPQTATASAGNVGPKQGPTGQPPERPPGSAPLQSVVCAVTEVPPPAPPGGSLGSKLSPRIRTGAGPSRRSYVLPSGPRAVSERLSYNPVFIQRPLFCCFPGKGAAQGRESDRTRRSSEQTADVAPAAGTLGTHEGQGPVADRLLPAPAGVTRHLKAS